jgi:hypothetical protein
MSFANHKGGMILFGVKDNPREIVGLNPSSSFHKLKTEVFAEHIKIHFSKVPQYDIGFIDIDDEIKLGYIEVLEDVYKPIICLKNSDGVLKEGMIYYRYYGSSEVIKSGELGTLIQELKRKERDSILNNIHTILKYGPENTRIFRTDIGEMTFSDKVKVIVDETLLNNIRKEAYFIDSGRISDSGKHAIKIIGSIQSSPTTEVLGDPNITHPYRLTELAKKLDISNYELQCLIYKFKIKGDNRYHYAHKNGKLDLHKYSRETEKFLSKYAKDKKVINQARIEYSNRNI